MHLEHAVQVAAAACTLNRIQSEYLELKNNATTFSIHELLSSGHFNLNQFCTAFTPHPNAPGLIANAKEYSERYGIWLPNAEQYITCCMYLFPHAPLYRMYPIVKNCAVDFYLNDVMGREVYPRLSQAEKTRPMRLKTGW
ncbi:hypothetical protein [Paraflavitalea speifideaquila]|uniref:hypothetical protein n=1 Tax=Paraflavitalea speifideaquila TaxID=3076558 RepID=UPI0028E30286|nr:hypothetical protein [Paraflavitalea speifideiaquila]